MVIPASRYRLAGMLALLVLAPLAVVGYLVVSMGAEGGTSGGGSLLDYTSSTRTGGSSGGSGVVYVKIGCDTKVDVGPNGEETLKGRPVVRVAADSPIGKKLTAEEKAATAAAGAPPGTKASGTDAPSKPSSKERGQSVVNAKSPEAADAAAMAAGGVDPEAEFRPPEGERVLKTGPSPAVAKALAEFKEKAHPMATLFDLDSQGADVAEVPAEGGEGTAAERNHARAVANQAKYLANVKARNAKLNDELTALRAAVTAALAADGIDIAKAAKGKGAAAAGAALFAQDLLQQIDDSIYFSGVPAFMREDWGTTRSSDAVFPHALMGGNPNNDPRSLNFVLDVEGSRYGEVRPHVFSRLPWRHWYKAIGLSRPPREGLKGASRAQSFDGRAGFVDATGKGADERILLQPHVEFKAAPEGKGLPVPTGDRRTVAVAKRRRATDGLPVVSPDPDEPGHKYYQEVVKLAAAFAIYDQNPRAESVIPAYTTACVGGADCIYIGHHIDRVYEFGVGYFVWFVNTKDSGVREFGELMVRAFPGRFIMITNEERVGASGTWNRFIDMFFKHTSTPIPWFLNANGDFFPREDPLEDFLRYMQHIMLTNPRHTIIKFQHYSFFAYTYRAYMVLGTFDESVFPAYGEDVEMVYRARSMGLTFDDYGAAKSQYDHIGSASLRDPIMSQQNHRWSRDNYVKQKWNINMYSTHWENVDFGPIHKNPWGYASIPHRSSYAIDAAHVRCIRTGSGDKIPGREQCFWHGDAIERLMPKGESVSSDFTQHKVWNV